jgi:hypothetical protein
MVFGLVAGFVVTVKAKTASRKWGFFISGALNTCI